MFFKQFSGIRSPPRIKQMFGISGNQNNCSESTILLFSGSGRRVKKLKFHFQTDCMPRTLGTGHWYFCDLVCTQRIPMTGYCNNEVTIIQDVIQRAIELHPPPSPGSQPLRREGGSRCLGSGPAGPTWRGPRGEDFEHFWAIARPSWRQKP